MGREGKFVEYYREYLEVVPDDGSPPYAAEVRLCHDFPEMEPTGSNRVVVFDDRVPNWISNVADEAVSPVIERMTETSSAGNQFELLVVRIEPEIVRRHLSWLRLSIGDSNN